MQTTRRRHHQESTHVLFDMRSGEDQGLTDEMPEQKEEFTPII